ncbi:MAG: twin-arginine translocation signal domain-containing protein, partial [Desulfobacteraceae bacterium]
MWPKRLSSGQVSVFDVNFHGKDYTVITDITRRQFLGYSLMAGAGLVVAPGCAVNPVTGENQLMM